MNYSPEQIMAAILDGVSHDEDGCTYDASALQVVKDLLSQLATANERVKELEKYAARENSQALSYIKNPCEKHNQYWTTASGSCMACRAEEAEALVKQLTERAERAEKKNTKLLAAFEAVRALKPHVERGVRFMQPSHERLVLEDKIKAADAALRELGGE